MLPKITNRFECAISSKLRELKRRMIEWVTQPSSRQGRILLREFLLPSFIIGFVTTSKRKEYLLLFTRRSFLVSIGVCWEEPLLYVRDKERMWRRPTEESFEIRTTRTVLKQRKWYKRVLLRKGGNSRPKAIREAAYPTTQVALCYIHSM